MHRTTNNYQVTITTSPTLITQFQKDRIALLIRNDSGSTIYVSKDSANILTQGMSLPTGTARTYYKSLGDDLDRNFYGQISANSATISIEEILEDTTEHRLTVEKIAPVGTGQFITEQQLAADRITQAIQVGKAKRAVETQTQQLYVDMQWVQACVSRGYKRRRNSE